jgi:ribosomal protein S12 methylthiotransferase accessory factor
MAQMIHGPDDQSRGLPYRFTIRVATLKHASGKAGLSAREIAQFMTAAPLRLKDAIVLVDMPVGDSPVHVAVALPAPALRAVAGFPAAALPEAGHIAAGRGLTRQQCHASARGEAIEVASCARWGDEAVVRASLAEVGAEALPAGTLLGWTARQIAERRSWNARFGTFDRRAPVPSRTRPADWLVVHNLATGKPRLAPTDLVLIGRAARGPRADSNGCAAGPTREQATVSAILELVERDATGRWWYGRRSRPGLRWQALGLPPRLLKHLRTRLRRTHVVDITSDIAIPVAAAFSCEPDGSDVVLGFAARPSLADAAASALTEMLQQEIALAQARVMPGRSRSWSYWRRSVTASTPPLAAAWRDQASPVRHRLTDGDSLAALIDACTRCNVDLYGIELTRPVFGVPVVRVLSTTLCHYKPRFARARLLAPDEDGDSPIVSRRNGVYLSI